MRSNIFCPMQPQSSSGCDRGQWNVKNQETQTQHERMGSPVPSRYRPSWLVPHKSSWFDLHVSWPQPRFAVYQYVVKD